VNPASVSAGAQASPSRGRALRWLLTIVVAAVLWVWLLRHANLSALAQQAGRLPAWGWCAAAAGLLGGHGLRAWRLQREWRHIRHASLWQCLRILLLHNAMVLLMPLRSGEVGFLWGVQREWGVGWGAAGVVLLRWRLQDALVLAFLALLLFVPVPLSIRVLLAAACALVLFVSLPTLWAWLLARTGRAGAGAPASWWGGFPASVANWTLKVIANGGLLAALAGIPWLAGLRGGLGGELAGVQPLQPPAGLGTYEAGMWFGTALPAHWQAQVVSAALAVHAFSLAVALLAALVTRLPLPTWRGGEKIAP
jgi:hypothetical protein